MNLQPFNLQADASVILEPHAAARALQVPAIVFDGVTKRYGAVCALNDVSFRIVRGDIVALVGPNGAGKSTLVEIIMGLRAADEGHVEVLGDDVTAGKRGYVSRLGVQLQESKFFPNLTGMEYLRFFRSLYPVTMPIDSLVEQLDLGAFISKPIRAMSGGQRQRIALALAVINDPDIVILDEPTVGLDPIARRSFWDIIRRLHAGGRRTLLFSTHYMEEAAAIASDVLMISEGSLIASGGLADVIAGAGAANLDDAYNRLVSKRTGDAS